MHIQRIAGRSGSPVAPGFRHFKSGGFAMLKHQKQQGDNAFWLLRQRRFRLKIAGAFFN